MISQEGLRFEPYDDPDCTVGIGQLIHAGRCDGRNSEEPFRPRIAFVASCLNQKPLC